MPDSNATPDGSRYVQTEPVPTSRSDTHYLDDERRQGGLPDDPTESGEPIRNRRSFTGLKGGR